MKPKKTKKLRYYETDEGKQHAKAIKHAYGQISKYINMEQGPCQKVPSIELMGVFTPVEFQQIKAVTEYLQSRNPDFTYQDFLRWASSLLIRQMLPELHELKNHIEKPKIGIDRKLFDYQMGLN